MSIVRSRKARILEKAGLRYVAGWLQKERAEEIKQEIEAAKPAVEEAIKDV